MSATQVESENGVVADDPVLRLRNVSKRFPGQVALDRVNLDLHGGVVHGLVGQNGSGKSTLIKILAGFHEPESGSNATLDGKPYPLGSSQSAEPAGLRFIHQDLGLVPTLSTIDNLALGHGYASRRFIKLRREARQAQRAIAELGFHFNVHAPTSSLTPVERSVVALTRALHPSKSPMRVLVLDEPTESMGRTEVGRLFDAINRATSHGVAVLYVSHRLEEVLAISRDISVLREGRKVVTRRADELDHDKLVELILGRKPAVLNTVARPEARDTVMTVSGLSGKSVRQLDLTVHRGELLGVAGVVGSGREELPYLLTGARPSQTGTIVIQGRARRIATPRNAQQNGVTLVAGDRNGQSAIQTMFVRENLTLPKLTVRGPIRWLNTRREAKEAGQWMRRLDVRPLDPERQLATLSGGNQQKVVLARALRLEPTVLVIDEPVQGVDVGAKVAIFQLLREVTERGGSVIVASAEADDLARLCDRVIVMRGGELGADLRGASLTADRVAVEMMRPVDLKEGTIGNEHS